MQPSERIAVLIFLGSVALLYGAAGTIVLRAAWRKVRGQRRERSPAAAWTRRGVLGLAIAGLGCMVYGRFIEPFWLEVRRIRLKAARLVGATRPVRIAHFTDAHCETYARLEEDVPDVIRDLKPDVICFTGDALNDRGSAWRFRRCMQRLAQIAPVLAVRGNWDVGIGPEVDLFGRDGGATELDDDAVKLNLAGADVWFAGASVRDESNVGQALNAAPDGACKVLLYHFPGPILDVAARGDVDLQLSGHTHGGQVAIPGYGALVTFSRHGKRFERGLYNVDGTHLYVGRGIGMEGRSAPRVRFHARPEVTLIELAPAGDRREGDSTD